ncbi:hypothetical protein [Thalassovita sp.]|uniref:hypothetical protein n=1 Tax=Thalassovita sp. TaxID=1979401 RepID=UPI002B267FBA|nr:hypothetical protein [Thalassovita sp.]
MFKKFATVAFVLAASSAHAADFKVYGLGGSDTVFVWKNKASHDEALDLISANVHKSNPALVMRLLSCIVPSGTGVIITDMGFATHDIMVIDGEKAGCRGNIPAEALKSN